MALKFAVQKPVGDVSVFKSTFHLDYSIRILEIWSVFHVPFLRGSVLSKGHCPAGRGHFHWRIYYEGCLELETMFRSMICVSKCMPVQ